MGNELSCREFTRRACLVGAASLAVLGERAAPAAEAASPTVDWLPRWEKYILGSARDRACDRETGEEIGWLISPHLNGFYYGYLATGQEKWLDLLVDWADAWIKRGVKEPDGFVGWPKADGASTQVMAGLFTDNQLGEAMGLRPVVLAASAILKSAALKQKYGAKAEGYLQLAEQIFTKWESRGCWRSVKAGGVWVVPPFGIDQKSGNWSEGYARRTTDGFSHPANKQNAIAEWLLAMHDATGKAVYKERAEAWFEQMKSRIRVRDGKYYVWNYWDPAGPWDYKPDGSTKHWVGVHPNGGYYGVDVDCIVAAHEHGLVFGKEEIDRLIATNRDFMWNHLVKGANFQRIDGDKPDARWQNSPGVLWMALVRHDATLRKVFEANHNPGSWGGMASTPRYLSWHLG